MTEEQYRLLCSECDSLLQQNNETIAIPWLHVQREHPESLKPYEVIFTSKRLSSIQFELRIMRRLFTYLGAQVARLIVSFFKRPQAINNYQNLSNIDVLFISHLVNKSQLDMTEDFYFGQIPALCRGAGFNTAVVLIDHTQLSSKNETLQFDCKYPVILLPKRSAVKMELSVFRETVRLLSMVSGLKATTDLGKRIIRFAMVEALSGQTCQTIRLKYQLDDILKCAAPKKLIFTWEGHAWERLLVALTKKNPRSIESIGYQHAILSRLQHAACRPLGGAYDPDRIWTAGLAGKIRLLRSTLCPSLGISVVGSNRAHADKNHARVEHTEHHDVAPTILVIPEGLLSECAVLLSFSLECAKKHTNAQFIWRLHPSIDFGILLSLLPELRDRPQSIRLSTATLEADIDHATHVLYRGSTAVIKAAAKGLQPIYLHQHGELKIDPLYALDKWKATVRSVDEFITEITKKSTSTAPKERHDAMAYVQDFFVPIADADILSCLETPIRHTQ